MSYSISGVEAIAVKITGTNYVEKLKEDFKKSTEDSNFINTLSEKQKHLFEEVIAYVLADFEAEKNLESTENHEIEKCLYNYDCEIYRYYDGGRNSENYAYIRPIDVSDGTFGYSEVFDGVVHEFSWGSSSIYKPEYQNKKELLKEAAENLYIPTGFNLEENIVFLTAVVGG